VLAGFHIASTSFRVSEWQSAVSHFLPSASYDRYPGMPERVHGT
jgi:hypothetical protein